MLLVRSRPLMKTLSEGPNVDRQGAMKDEEKSCFATVIEIQPIY